MSAKQRVNGPARLRWMHDRLADAYGPQHWWPAETAFEVILGAYLTQNTAWTNVELALTQLRAAELLSVEGIRRVRLSRLERLIRSKGVDERKLADDAAGPGGS